MMIEAEKLVYMIRRNSDGLYSTGGTSPRFNKRGKGWTSLGALKNHLNQAINYPRGRKVHIDLDFMPYLDCTGGCVENHRFRCLGWPKP